MSLDLKRIIVGILGMLFLIALLIVAWIEGGKQRITGKEVPVASGVSKACVECHAEVSPVIVTQWAESTHAKRGVSCYECHQAVKEKDADAWKHEGHVIRTIVTPNTCATCHQQEFSEFTSSHHAKGAQFIGSLDNILGEMVEGVPAAVGGCQQCHGSTVS
ncbi:MAG: ammonia-forming cytochrome c nitrite reductase subunit c552, partial [Deltaproteobacteria bacterium]|nr:ammonia-forming cytochrome c nitrite reductase subunit c552 [Deltaproteobacteria bacterium]